MAAKFRTPLLAQAPAKRMLVLCIKRSLLFFEWNHKFQICGINTSGARAKK